MGQAIGIDVGGTKVGALRVDATGGVLARESVASPATDQVALVEAMTGVAGAVMDPAVVAVGVGAAGMVDHRSGVLRSAPNLAWRELPIAAVVSEATGLPCVADNDANVAAWGEWKVGAGRGFRHLLVVTIGTGIGGGIIADGALLRGAHGFAGEIGHIVVEPGGPECGCGNRGCWEQVASGRAIDRLAREAVGTHPGSVLGREAGGDPGAATGEMVTRAARAGDTESLRILAEVGSRLGTGLAGLANVLDPEAIVIGGGGAGSGDLLLEPARAAFRSAIEDAERRPEVPILQAQLGNDAGAIGAALMALEERG